ncbi:hypothetical protein [Nocardia sp. NBC_01009]|uniref:hypothetical protein n=1 Tax=Nocardia sp. NBC_01009 TaxID=2975996 RepID=UPI003868925B|nr:hypothetical protein OHA42_02850 [Nocardia sp. NBC_01009]
MKQSPKVETDPAAVTAVRALATRRNLRNRFPPRAALVEAFTEVELRGDSACGPAKILHQLVVENVRGR